MMASLTWPDSSRYATVASAKRVCQPPPRPGLRCLALAVTSTSLLLAGPAWAAPPTVYFPLNSQLPPVARLGQPFSLTPSPQTFASSSPLDFSLAAPAPAWLSIDAETGRLFGTPTDRDVVPGDVVGVPIQMVAADGEGNATMDATLVVSRNPSPAVLVPLDDQIAGFGDFSAPSTILSYSSAGFSYVFRPDTFTHPGPINYYATSADGSPLPSWVNFDTATLTFYGTTPPSESLVQPPETFGFQLVASDVVGFSAAPIFFSLAIGIHKLAIEPEIVLLNATRGREISFGGLMGSMRLDGKPIRQGDVTLESADVPSWISISNETFDIGGTPPQSATSENFTVTFRDNFSDTLTVDVIVEIQSDVFSQEISSINISPGDNVDFDLAPYFWSPQDVEVTVEAQPTSGWLSVANLTLVGTVPESEALGAIRVFLRAASTTSNEVEVEEFDLNIVASAAAAAAATHPLGKPSITIPIPSKPSLPSTQKKGGPLSSPNAPDLNHHHPSSPVPDPASPSGSDTATTSSPAAADSGKQQQQQQQHDRDRASLPAGAIAAAVIAPLSLIAVLAAFLCCRRRRKKQYRERVQRMISPPVAQSLTVNGFSADSRLPSTHDIARPFGAAGGFGGFGLGVVGSSFGGKSTTADDNSPRPSLPDYRPGQRGYSNAVMQDLRLSRTVGSLTGDMPAEYLSPEPGHGRTRSVSEDVARANRSSWLATDRLLKPRSRPKPKPEEPPNHLGSVGLFSPDFLAGPRDGYFGAVLAEVCQNQSSHSIQLTPEAAYSRRQAATGSRVDFLLPGTSRNTERTSAMASSDAHPSAPPTTPPRSRPHSPMAAVPMDPQSLRPRTSGPVGRTAAPSGRMIRTVPTDSPTPERPTRTGDDDDDDYGGGDGPGLRDVSPENERNSIRYVKRPRQARLSSHQFPARRLSRRTNRSVTSSIFDDSSLSDSVDLRRASSRGSLPRRLSRLSLVLGGGGENWTALPRDSLGISYGELVESVPYHPSRGTLSSFRSADARALREQAQGPSLVPAPLKPGSSGQESAGGASIGKAVSRYSRTGPGFDFGEGQKENSDLSNRSGRTDLSGKAFL